MSIISDFYQQLGGVHSPLGKAIGPESDSHWGGQAQKYEQGQIYHHADCGVHALTGATLETFVTLGGTEVLGYPLEDTFTMSKGQGAYLERGCIWAEHCPMAKKPLFIAN